jgi:UDP-N-acetyl-D-glucosamine dehydrogenase
MLTTDHTDFDYKEIAQNSPVVFDTRNAFKEFQADVKKYHLL